MIRHFLLSLLTVTSLITLDSCDNGTQKLSREVEGSWSAAPSKMVQSPASEATIIETFDFLGNDSVNGGNIIISSIVSVTGTINGSEAIVQPFSLTASGAASISGSWRAIDDDELSVTLDMRTLEVRIDPSAVVLSTNLLTGSESPSLDDITPAITAQIKVQVAKALEMRYLSMKHLDDVKIKDNIMKYELAGVDYVLQRQGLTML